MTILQGTMQDGTVIPVQVDAQGRLVAEGLPGPPGPAGADGGAFVLPPDPQDGWILGWENGALAWVEVSSKPPVSGAPTSDVIVGVRGGVTAADVALGPGTTAGHGGYQPGGFANDGKIENLFNGVINGQNSMCVTTRATAGVYFTLTLPYKIPVSTFSCRYAADAQANGIDPFVQLFDGGVPGTRTRLRWHAWNGTYPWPEETYNIAPTTGLVNKIVFDSDNGDTNLMLSSISIDGAPLDGSTVLTFASDIGLSKFAQGDSVAQDDNAAQGTVGSMDLFGRKMRLATSTGFWSANTGNFVVGPPPAMSVRAIRHR